MKTSDLSLAYTLARLGMGVNLATHGISRIPKVGDFASWMTTTYDKTWLPEVLVKPFAHSLPFIELGLGILILLGLFSRQAIVLASLLIITLIFGSCLIQMWEAAGSQMVYLSYLAGLLVFREKYNNISVDQIISK